MYKPSKVKHPSLMAAPGKNKKGEPAYASTAITPAGPEATRDYTPADEAAYAESTTHQSTHAEAAAVRKPTTVESTSEEPLPATAAREPYVENRTGEETHRPVLNVDEQKKVVNQPASSAAANDELEEF